MQNKQFSPRHSQQGAAEVCVSHSSRKPQYISGNDCRQPLSVQLDSLIKSFHIQTVGETVPRQSENVLSSERKAESCAAGMHNKKRLRVRVLLLCVLH